MATLQVFKNELLTHSLNYLKFVEEMVKLNNNYERDYSVRQVIAYNNLVNGCTKTTELYDRVSHFLETDLPRPWTERMRYAFDIVRKSDLHNNIQWELKQEKYKRYILELIDHQAETKHQYDAELKRIGTEARQHPEVVANKEIIALKNTNAELNKTIARLQEDLNKAEQKRDYWNQQYDMINERYENVIRENKKLEQSLRSANAEVEHLRKSNTSQQPQKEAPKPEPTKFHPCKP